MESKDCASWVSRYLGMCPILLVLVACSDEPKQQTEKPKPAVKQEIKETVVAKPEPLIKDEPVKEELLTAMKEAEMALQESQELLSEAPAGKDSDTSLRALDSELQAAERRLSDARGTIEQGDYTKAKTQIREIKDAADHVKQQITQAKQKLH